MNSPEVTLFLSEATRHGRTLPFSEAISFFRGFVFAAQGGLSPESEDELRATTTQLNICESQLELLASGETANVRLAGESVQLGAPKKRRAA